MKLNSIRLRLTVGVVLVTVPFLLFLSHVIVVLVHGGPGHHGGGAGDSRRLLFTLSWVAAAAFGITAWLLVGRTLSPIRQLAQQARESGTEGEVAPLTPSSSDPEIIELVETFNGLMKRVHASAESKARFYAAASHELRTPLQALLGHLELSVSRERSAEEMQATIGESLVQTRRLIGLVEGILLLQRIDSERGTREPVDAAVVVRECLDQVEPPVVSEIADSAQVLSYSSHLEILFVNLLSNAIRHGKEDSVEVRLSEGRLTVSNLVLAGVKVEAEELKAPFSSAYRSRASDVAGNGLGLAICRSICEANQWTLEIQVEPTRFVVQVSF